MKLWLLRHARVQVASGVCYGASDVGWDAAAADATARAFASCPAQGSVLWASPSGRTRQLALRLQALRPDLEGPHVDARLQEMDFGHWEMQAWDAIPRAAVDAWVVDFPHHRFGGQESTQDVIDRVAEALDQARALHVTELVWVTHAGVIKAVQFLCAAAGRRRIASADEWPAESLPMGAWLALDA